MNLKSKRKKRQNGKLNRVVSPNSDLKFKTTVNTD